MITELIVSFGRILDDLRPHGCEEVGEVPNLAALAERPYGGEIEMLRFQKVAEANDFSYVANFPHLRSVLVTYGSVSDLSPLVKLPDLKELSF